MNLPDRIKLINRLIKVNQDICICDYLQILAKKEAVEQPEIIEPVMNKPQLYTAEDADFITRHHADITAREIAWKLDLSEETVRNFGSRYGLIFKKPTLEQKRAYTAGYIPDAPKAKIIRAPAVYDNPKTNYV